MADMRNARGIIQKSLNILDSWWRRFIFFIPIEFLLALQLAFWTKHPIVILGQTFLLPIVVWLLFIFFIRPSYVFIADTGEDMLEKVVEKLGGSQKRMHDRYEGLLESARLILGFRILLGIALALWLTPGNKDLPFAMSFGLALIAFWTLRHTRLRKYSVRLAIAIALIFLVGGWREIHRKAEIVRYHVDTRTMPSMHELFPGLSKTEKVQIKAGKNIIEGEFLLPPGKATIWIDRPDTSYRFAWDVPKDFAPYVDTEREYIDGTTRIVNCLVEEEKPIARVRFIHTGKSVSIPIKMWNKQLPS